MVILREQFIDTASNSALCRVELAVDSASQLPAGGSFTGRTLAAGSLAWDISTGAVYGMTSAGVWINQATGEAYIPETPAAPEQNGSE